MSGTARARGGWPGRRADVVRPAGRPPALPAAPPTGSAAERAAPRPDSATAQGGPRGVGEGRERGSATAELAAGLPVVMLLLLAGLTAVGAVLTKLQCVDAAQQAALAASRGQPGAEAGRRVAPDDAQVTVAVTGDTVVATVRAPVPLAGLGLPMTVTASAVAAVEPGAPGPAR